MSDATTTDKTPGDDPLAGLRVQECLTEAEVAACYPVMHELRDTMDRETFLARVAIARADGYRLFRFEDDGGVVALLSCHLAHELTFGRSLYIDELVVTAKRRSGGLGAALLRFAEDLAKQQGCSALRLHSGLKRTDSHRFYEANGVMRRGYVFAKPFD